MRAPLLLPLVSVALLFGCEQEPDPFVPDMDAGSDSGAGDSGIRDAGNFDANRPPQPDAGSFWEMLYGGNDAVLPGNTCSAPAEDRCRGSAALYVCMDDDRNPTGAGATCHTCESQAECRLEYPFLPDTIDCQGGLCVLPGGNTCTPGSGHCRTARAGDFVCVDGDCVKCISVDECTADYGSGLLCIFTGQCAPPDAGMADGG